MLHNRANSLRPICKIDVTAFASMMLVVILTLLIIEMVAFPLAWGHHGVGIDLPRVNHPVNMIDANRQDPMVVAIMRDGKVFFGNERVTAEQLTTKIRKRLSHHAERKVFIRADARVRYGTVSAALDGIRSAGVLRIGILVDQRKRPASYK
jgi:biopolymer transport protein TolR